MSAAVLVALALVVLWAGGIVFGAFVTCVALLAAWEWGRMQDGRPFGSNFWPAALAVIAAEFAFFIDGLNPALWMVLLIALAAAGFAGFRRKSISISLFGVLYIALPALALVTIRGVDKIGALATILLFAAVWATDIGAYFAGKTIGGAKLAPSISPGKTWSGAIGGLAAAAIAGAIMASIVGHTSTLSLCLFAVVLSAASQVGDLFESATKRQAGVKDSSRLIPGHGGVLDRIDGLVFAATVAFAVGLIRSGSIAPARGVILW